jgi:hypothetical protein
MLPQQDCASLLITVKQVVNFALYVQIDSMTKKLNCSPVVYTNDGR